MACIKTSESTIPTGRERQNIKLVNISPLEWVVVQDIKLVTDMQLQINQAAEWSKY